MGELGLWMWRAGALDRPPEGMALPYRLEISGDWQAAAAAWRRLGCPYEESLALAHGDRPAQLRALEILTGLGAIPAAAMVRRNLRAEGARGIPRGPRAATRHNPLGLTTRQVDILALLAEDLSNKEIAARLRIAPKTVDHHVCAVLAKLEVSTRKQAARHPVTRALLAGAGNPGGDKLSESQCDETVNYLTVGHAREPLPTAKRAGGHAAPAGTLRSPDVSQPDMTTDRRIARRKLSLLELAQDLGNVSKACKLVGYSRQQFHEIVTIRRAPRANRLTTARIAVGTQELYHGGGFAPRLTTVTRS